MNIDKVILLIGIAVSTLGCVWIISKDWRRYGLLFLISSAIGETLCYIFVKIGFYSFPLRLLPNLSPMPFFVILTMIPLYVLLGVRYSPVKWQWKIPFYWVFVHVGMMLEVLALNFTSLIRYNRLWDAWDSYTWWWIYLLIFEYIGGIIVPSASRRPINTIHLRYGRLGWFLLHFVLIATVFLGGFYVGRVTSIK
ncbi:CBO0543 family protein [Paenibacillus glycanilyticus]|uniref:CBO0543 family protein n=1 Tax=Paenibacillus glycanilyticus TaxID=126569 RepID=UPI001910AE21|nr:CBO0543 family protein [Paenibacillus glycanilyticus]